MSIQIEYKTLLYGVASSALFGAVARWTGLWRWLSNKSRRRRAYRAYARATRDIIATATVVGRRQGFDIAQIYVDLDLAPSDLMVSPPDAVHTRPTVFVLVGGPGAGKSTFVKREALKILDEAGVPFFLRLRDYAGDEPIESYFINRLRQAGLPQPEREFDFAMRIRGAFLILDGLDEVRLLNRVAVCERINAFYKKYFAPDVVRSRLIVTCRKEAYRSIPLDIPTVWEVRPLTDEQIQRFAALWPLGYPAGKSADAFCADLFATPKILQLARSPLLLVGGLMQYSESNLGIPEERFEYLARIARWLLSDWAAAQGLPPDPMRPLYERVIPRMALEMHTRTTAELPIGDALSLLEEWLPQYGTSSHEAQRVLDGIFSRTGILVRDVPGAVVFAQFSLQEYFTATVIARTQMLQNVIGGAVATWWREAVLLAVAQLEEPSPILNALFAQDGTLGAEAVAECPTPSLSMQVRAVQACTVAIDARDEASHRATVALLRKIAPEPEGELLRELDARLVRADVVASTVGLILAHAGTSRATALLAARPDVWDSCLRSAGYLSSSFEQVLVGVIAEGLEANARKAMNLLVPRLSVDRRRQLISMLTSLAPDRAAGLAGLLLNTLEPEARYYELDELDLDAIALCAVHLNDLDQLPRGERQSAWYGVSLPRVAVTLGSTGVRSPKRLAVMLARGIRWPLDRRSGCVVLGSALMAASALIGRRYWFIFATVAALVTMAAGFERWYVPQRLYLRRILHIRPWSAQAILVGVGITLALVGVDVRRLPTDEPAARALAAALLAIPAIFDAQAYLRRLSATDTVGQVVFGWCSVAGVVTCATVLSMTMLHGEHLLLLRSMVAVVIGAQLIMLLVSGVDARRFGLAATKSFG